MMSGCASVPGPRLDAGAGVELVDTPFYAQQRYQCGPAALATVLVDSGVPVTAASLVSQVWIPGRRGSLAPEITAAVRRADRLPYRVEPDLQQLWAAVNDGKPVMVLLDLGYGLLHAWHYAVVIGFDPAHQTVLLRSGTTRRRQIPIDGFDNAWRKADRWALVAAKPDQPPAFAQADRWLKAATDLQQTGAQSAAAALRAGAARWPESAELQFAYGNSAYQQGDLRRAEIAFARALEARPSWAPAANNLANLLMQRGCLQAAGKALASIESNPDDQYAAELADTRAELAAVLASSESREAGSECSAN